MSYEIRMIRPAMWWPIVHAAKPVFSPHEAELCPN
jgi:hypothetical protein